MAKKMLIDATHPEETRVVVLDGNKVEDFDFETIHKRQTIGNIYLAKVIRIEPSLQAAFVEYGGNRHGFLAFSEIHPDYYQIPVEDRKALLAEERALHRAEADSDALRGRNARHGAEPATVEKRIEERENALESADAAAGPLNAPRSATEELQNALESAHLSANSAAPALAALSPHAESSQPAEAASLATTSSRQDQAAQTGDGGAQASAELSFDTPFSAREAILPAEPAAERDSAAAQEAEGTAHSALGLRARQPSEPFPRAAAEATGLAGTRIVAGMEIIEPSAPTEEDAAEVEPLPLAPVSESLPQARVSESVGENAPAETEASLNGGEEEAEPYRAADHASEIDDQIETVADADVSDEVRAVRRPRPRRYKIQEVIKPRQIMLVQVVKEERGTKGAALTTYLSLAGRYCVLMPNTPRGGGISRKITNPADRKKLREIAAELDVPEGAGLIIRTAGANRSKQEIRRDYEYLCRLWDQIRELTLRSIAPAQIYAEGDLIKRALRDMYTPEIEEILVEGEEGYRAARDFMKMIMPDQIGKVKLYSDPLPLFARYQVESYLASMFNPVVPLKSGGHLVIGVTEALVAIDVNSGKSTRQGSIEQTALQTNLEAAEEIARQLRLRDLAGLIVIDFIDMEERKHNALVEKRLKEALRNDRARIQVGRISGFGLLEMSRQRLRPGMLETTTQPCPHCHGTGLIRSDNSVALAVLRAIEEEAVRGRSKEVLVRAPVGVVNYLFNQKRERIDWIEKRYGIAVRIEADPNLVSPDYHLEKFKTTSRELPAARPVVSLDAEMMGGVDATLGAVFSPEEEVDAAGETGETQAQLSETDAAPLAAPTTAPADGATNAGEGNASEAGRRRRRRRRRRRHGEGRLAEQSAAKATALEQGAEMDEEDEEDAAEDGSAEADARVAAASADAPQPLARPSALADAPLTDAPLTVPAQEETAHVTDVAQLGEGDVRAGRVEASAAASGADKAAAGISPESGGDTASEARETSPAEVPEDASLAAASEAMPALSAAPLPTRAARTRRKQSKTAEVIEPAREPGATDPQGTAPAQTLATASPPGRQTPRARRKVSATKAKATAKGRGARAPAEAVTAGQPDGAGATRDDEPAPAEVMPQGERHSRNDRSQKPNAAAPAEPKAAPPATDAEEGAPAAQAPLPQEPDPTVQVDAGGQAHASQAPTEARASAEPQGRGLEADAAGSPQGAGPASEQSTGARETSAPVPAVAQAAPEAKPKAQQGDEKMAAEAPAHVSTADPPPPRPKRLGWWARRL